MPPETYRDIFKPRHAALTRTCTSGTPMHTFLHTCGSIHGLLPDLIEAGYDMINPVPIIATGSRNGGNGTSAQTSRSGAAARTPARVLPGPPAEVKEQVRRNSRLRSGRRVRLRGGAQHSPRGAAGKHRRHVRGGRRVPLTASNHRRAGPAGEPAAASRAGRLRPRARSRGRSPRPWRRTGRAAPPAAPHVAAGARRAASRTRKASITVPTPKQEDGPGGLAERLMYPGHDGAEEGLHCWIGLLPAGQPGCRPPGRPTAGHLLRGRRSRTRP